MDYFCGYYPKQMRKSEQRENSAQGQVSASDEAGASLLVQHCEYPQGQVLLACMGLSLQEENAESPMKVVLSGIVISARLLHE